MRKRLYDEQAKISGNFGSLYNHGRDSGKRSKRKKIIVFAMVIILVAIIVYIYLAVFHPLITWMYFPPKLYKGVELYDQREFLSYENGESFSRFTSSLEFIEECEISEFYYFDNHRRDNILYGKCCDIFALDLFAKEEQYKKIKETVVEKSLSKDEAGNYMLYQQPKTNESLQIIEIVAFNDINDCIRCIIITDHEVNRTDFGTMLVRQTTLDWFN